MAKWPKRIAVGYICSIIILAMGYFIGFYSPSPGTIEDEIYFPYFFVSGPIVFVMASMASVYTIQFIEMLFNYHVSFLTETIIVTGLFHIVFGSIQWYYVTKWSIAVWKFLQATWVKDGEKKKDDI